MASTHEHSVEAMHIWLHVHTALLGIIFLLVLILNSLLIFVLQKMKSRRSNRDRASYNIERSYMYLLFHLALADMLGVVLNILFDILRNAGIQYYFTNAGCQILPPFQLASTTAQAGTYVALSYHRFRAIVHPIKAKLTVYRSLIWIGIIWVVSVALSMPYVIAQKFDEANGSCFEDWSQENAGNIYTFAIFVVQYAAPVVLMAIFYVNIARALHEHRIQKELVQVPTQDDVRSHKHIVKMLVTIVTVYSVCMLPHHLFWIVAGEQEIEEDVYKTVASVSYLFTYSNSVANPLVFFFYNKESRYHLKRFFKMVCRCCTQNMDVPFEIKKWSATWSGQSKSDSQHHERRSSKDHLKLDQLFLAKQGDSDLGVSLPWEAQVMNSHSSEEHNYHPSSPPLPELSVSSGNPLESPTNATNSFRYYGVPKSTIKYPSDTTLDVPHESPGENEESLVDGNICKIEIIRGVENSEDEDVEKDGESGGDDCEKGDEIYVDNAEEEKDEEEVVFVDTPWADDETEVASNCSEDCTTLSEDDTARVQDMIERMMRDIRHELKQDGGGINGMKQLEDILNLNESSSNGNFEVVINAEGLNGSAGHLETAEDLLGYEQEIGKVIDGLRERLESLPETRM